ncbi:OTU domain-containing protein, putative [Plasmodium vinckei lentum]|uniref:OTU domain-containing protein, putative n=1 Tax=Plasmodium vinckei lentum TaxID=138297 RepID=A0A6V7S6H6_PLAVN|nr:OTU domain-containing protein, putative [Plasmodium vinckei lentum]
MSEEVKKINYNEYKRRLKKLLEEIKKEKKKKTIHKDKQNENILKLEEELKQLNELYNGKDNDNNNNTVVEQNNYNDIIPDNLYSYNVVSKKSLKNKAKMKRKEMEEELNEQSRSKVGEEEYNQLLDILKIKNQTIYSIAPDGNCLYESIIHQLKQRVKNFKYSQNNFLQIVNQDNFSLDNIDLKKYQQNINNFDFSIFESYDPNHLSSNILRFLTSVYILKNTDLFVNFIYEYAEEGNDDPCYSYCQQIMSGIYGSEIEITALSNILKKKITVQDINMSVSYGEDYEEELFICFHHKLYTLGKHYNSVIDL